MIHRTSTWRTMSSEFQCHGAPRYRRNFLSLYQSVRSLTPRRARRLDLVVAAVGERPENDLALERGDRGLEAKALGSAARRSGWRR